jgi:hypothetical protein
VAHEFTFRARVWLYAGNAPWHFVTLPKAVSRQIKTIAANANKAFGTVKVAAAIGETRWRTSIFPDKKLAAYVLPVKAAVRHREQIQPGVLVEVFLVIQPNVDGEATGSLAGADTVVGSQGAEV